MSGWPLKFGCRMFAAITPQPFDGQDRFIRQCLVDGENSLWKLSDPKHRDDECLKGEKLTSNGIQDDGWGVAYFGADGPVIHKSHQAAFQNTQFLNAAREAAESKSGVVLGHLREGNHPDPHNSHPFRLGPWLFMHNGTLPPRTLASLNRKLAAFQQAFGTPLPQGETDTERVFLYLMGQLQRKAKGPVSIGQLTPSGDELFRTFHETVSELTHNVRREMNPRGFWSWLKRLFGLEKKPACKPGLNFILSDGNRLLASCYGRRLYLGIYKGPDGTPMAALVSRKVKPVHGGGEPKIEWRPVPEGTILMLERTPEGIHLRQAQF